LTATFHFDDVRFPTLSPDDRGFIRFQRFASPVTNLWTSDLSVDGGGNDVYGAPAQLLSTAQECAVAPRAFGLPRSAMINIGDQSGGVVTFGDAVFDAQAQDRASFPHLEPERDRKDNLFLIHSGPCDYGWTDQIDIYQLHP
jgi:hypothetical protein